MTEKEYRAHKGINYSLLSSLATSPKGLVAKKKDESYFTLGSLVDCLCTTPEEFHNLYYVMTVTKPGSDMMQKYAEEYLATGSHTDALAASGYKSGITTPAKGKTESKWDIEGVPYYDALVAGKGKLVVSMEEYMQACQMKNILHKNEFTSKYFNDSNMFQVPIIWKYYGKECKALLDIIDIDHERKTIRPVDLKTTGKSVLSFSSAYISYKYYLQAAFYTNALVYAIKNDPSYAIYKEYAVLPFQFVVIETGMYNPPHIFEVDDLDMVVAENGGQTANGYEVKGYKQLIEELEYHRTTGQYDYKQDVYENSGVVSLNSLVLG